MNIVITGASRGIGYKTAEILARDGKNHVFAISRNLAGLTELKFSKIWYNDTGQENISIYPFDLVNGDYTQLQKEIASKLTIVDVLVNNAGMIVNKPFELIKDDEFDLIFQANVKSVFKLTRLLLPYFSENAHIVNIGSMGGVQGSVKFPGLSLYSASKGAVAVMTECLAEELKERMIKVNCLALGSVQTEMLQEAFPGYMAPLDAGQMAEFIADFSLNGHKWFNGKILPVALSTP